MTRIRALREARGMSQKFLALSVGVSSPTVSMWENGTKDPTRENLIKLADLFGVSVDYLLEREDQPGSRRGSVPATYEEAILVQIYRQLNTTGQALMIKHAHSLLEEPGLRQETSTASAV